MWILHKHSRHSGMASTFNVFYLVSTLSLGLWSLSTSLPYPSIRPPAESHWGKLRQVLISGHPCEPCSQAALDRWLFAVKSQETPALFVISEALPKFCDSWVQGTTVVWYKYILFISLCFPFILLIFYFFVFQLVPRCSQAQWLNNSCGRHTVCPGMSTEYWNSGSYLSFGVVVLLCAWPHGIGIGHVHALACFLRNPCVGSSASECSAVLWSL